MYFLKVHHFKILWIYMRNLKDEIIKLKDTYPFVNMKYYGFRDDWKELL